MKIFVNHLIRGVYWNIANCEIVIHESPPVAIALIESLPYFRCSQELLGCLLELPVLHG